MSPCQGINQTKGKIIMNLCALAGKLARKAVVHGTDRKVVHFTLETRSNREEGEKERVSYLDGNCFEPDLSQFWPIDPGLAAIIPPGMHHELARFQMGGKVTV